MVKRCNYSNNLHVAFAHNRLSWSVLAPIFRHCRQLTVQAAETKHLSFNIGRRFHLDDAELVPGLQGLAGDLQALVELSTLS